MRKEYDLNSLNITKQNRAEYRNIVNSPMNYFVDANFRKSNQISVIINYETENLLSFKQVKETNAIFKLQCGLSLIELIENSNRLFAVNIEPDNLFFDQGSRAYQLERIKDQKRKEQSHYVAQINAVLGALFTKDSYECILAENGKSLVKVRELKNCQVCPDLASLKLQLSQQINLLIREQNEKQIIVSKNYHKKKRRNSQLSLFAIIIFVFGLCFLMSTYIPNRNSQLTAYESYNDQVYEDVISELEDTDVRSMTPLTKYILSESAVRLSPFTTEQKDNILANLTPNVDEGILDFWVFLAQADIDRAYEQSIMNNDAQQKAFALLIYIDQVQNDPDLSATEKQQQIDTYNGELEVINESIAAEQEKEADEQ